MIGYLSGTILRNDDDGLLLLVNGIGYEILMPEILAKSFRKYEPGSEASLFIYYHQTERQPVPVLIGFENEKDKIFFKRFISVEDIGVIKAVKALTIPVDEIVSAIESEDSKKLISLKGIGKRTAGKIIATLKGKFDDFILEPSPVETPVEENADDKGFISSVVDVLTHQLGHQFREAQLLVGDALKRNPNISSPEELLEEVYNKKEDKG